MIYYCDLRVDDYERTFRRDVSDRLLESVFTNITLQNCYKRLEISISTFTKLGLW